MANISLNFDYLLISIKKTKEAMKRNIIKGFRQWAVAAMLFTAQSNGVAQTQVVLETTMGDMRLELNEKDTPLYSRNFKELVKKDFYDGQLFHRLAKYL